MELGRGQACGLAKRGVKRDQLVAACTQQQLMLAPRHGHGQGGQGTAGIELGGQALGP